MGIEILINGVIVIIERVDEWLEVKVCWLIVVDGVGSVIWVMFDIELKG